MGLQPHEKSHAEGVPALPKAGVKPEGAQRLNIALAYPRGDTSEISDS
ncbi:MAG TPA: hypothetical protein VK627_00565 [Edaphobacter sp.]|nr:hypothetical protein [Edaphobacter sp.]